MRSSMMTHMRTHSHHKGFRCEQCNKSFSSAGVLNYHQKYVYSLENRHLFIDTCFFFAVHSSGIFQRVTLTSGEAMEMLY